MATFAHPQKLFRVTYPAHWTPTGVVTPGASFAATVPGRGFLFEAFALLGPDEKTAVERVVNATLGSLRDDHPGLEVVSRGGFGAAHPGERVTVDYSEKVRGKFLPVKTRTDLFMLASGRRVLSLYFKTLAERYAGEVLSFEDTARSAAILDGPW